MKLHFSLLSFLLLACLSVNASGDRAALNNPNCDDVTACNYSTGDQPCEYTSCAGCLDELACNYDEDMTKSDGSCVFAIGLCESCSWWGSANPKDGTGTLVLADSDGDGICDSVDSCSDPLACNYAADPTAACVQSVEYYHDEDGDNIGDYSLGTFCSGDDIPGSSTTTLAADGGFDNCTDDYACNYDSATNDSCDDDTDGDGVCDQEDLCSNPNVPNFDADTNDDGIADSNESCCDDLNGNNTCDDREIFGCTDDQACNYFVHANVDDGTCQFHTASSALSSSGTSQYNQSLEDSSCDTCTANDSTVTITSAQMTNNGLASTSYTIGRYNGNDVDGDEVCDDAEQVGCEDPNACNYGLDVNGTIYGQAIDAYGNALTTDDNDGDGAADPLLITESCSYDDDLGYGVTPQGEQCTNWCKFDDVCGVCGGDGVDDDGDGVCDDVDSCTNITACNYDANPTAACQYFTECNVCASGSDADNDGYIDDNDDDSDDDGICDSSDNCFDTTACNYDDPDNVDCQVLDACDVCGGSGVDIDNDGLCDDIDNCTDSSKCNYDVADYPTNPSCFSDTDDDGVCDEFEVAGCKDNTACNYYADATDNDTSLCLYADDPCEACAGNSTDGSGSILLSDVDGDGVCDGLDLCEDVTACNFNANPTENCGTDSDENGVCDDDEVDGCKDTDACNYMASATRELNGTCIYAIGCQSCSGASDGTGTVVNNDSDFDGICDSQDECSNTSACNYVAATANNASCTFAESGKNCSGDCLADVDLDGICDENDLCTNTAACNYAEIANEACVYRNTCGICGEVTQDVAGFDPNIYCDCELNVVDELGNCGGSCEADIDGDGICDDVDPCLVAGEEPDACGVCNGPGAIYECGCFELPEEGCSCETSGTVTYPAQGEDCDGNCLYGTKMEMQPNGVEIEVCAFYDNAEVTALPTPTMEVIDSDGSVIDVTTNPFLLEDWIIKFDTLHSRMAKNLDDGSLTGASERVTIEEHIMDKGDLTVLGESRMSGFVQMDDDVVILGNLVVEQDATIKGTTFSRGGIETTSLIMEGDLTVGGSAVIDSTLEVMQKTLLQDTLTVYGDLLVGRDHVFTVDTFGNANVNGSMALFGTLDVASDSRLSDLAAGATTLSSLTSKGKATFNSDLEVHKNTVLKATLDVNQDATLNGQLDVQGASNFTGAITSTSINNSGDISSSTINNSTSLHTNTLGVSSLTTTQTLLVESNTDIEGNLTVSDGSAGNDLFIVANNSGAGLAKLQGSISIYADNSDLSDNTISPNTILSQDGAIDAASSVTASKFISDDQTATSELAGSLTVDKDVLVNQDFTAKASIGGTSATAFHVDYSAGTADLDVPTTISAATTFDSNASLTLNSGSNLTVGGTSNFQSLTATSLNTGSGTVTAGAVNLSGDLTQTGKSNYLKTAGKLLVGNTTSSTVPSGYLAYFDGKTNGTGNGIGISLNHNGGMPGNGNNYVTFYKANGQVAGRIEGQNSSDWTSNRGLVLDVSEHATDVAMDGAALALAGYRVSRYTAILSWQIGKALSHIIPDSWCCAMLIPVGCIIIPFPGWPMPDWGNIAPAGAEVAGTVQKANDKAVDFIFAAASFASSSSFLGVSTNIQDTEYGVAYATGDGDYAEWMPRENPRRNFHARQIVGVKNGSISLSTTDFDHLMVISSAPAVLGNVPEEEFKEDYEKVAFLGQVPVDVIGRVNSGDFILPSGDNDGFGIAIDPADISANQIEQIVGVAWSNGLNDGFNTINVAVGLANNASSHLVDELDTEIRTLAAEISDVKSYLIARNNLAQGNLKQPATELSTLGSLSNWKAQSQLPKTQSELQGEENELVNSEPSDFVTENVTEYPVFHGNQVKKETENNTRKEYISSYIASTEKYLEGIACAEDIENLGSALYNNQGFNPVAALDPSISEFEKRITENLFSEEKITKVVRQSVIGNEAFPSLESIQPDTQAELAYVKEIQKLIFESLEEARKR
jgi:cytoskeletal protein CcmA (bactofilin family)